MSRSFTLAELAAVKFRTPVPRMSGTIACAPSLSPKQMVNGESIQNFFIRDEKGTEIKVGIWSRLASPFNFDMRDYNKGFIEFIATSEGGLLWVQTNDANKFKLEVSPQYAEVKLLKASELRDGLPRLVTASAGTTARPSAPVHSPDTETLPFPKQGPATSPRQMGLSLPQIADLQRQCLEQSISLVRRVQTGEAKARAALGVEAVTLVEINFNPLLVSTYEMMFHTALASTQSPAAEGELAEDAPAKLASSIERLGIVVRNKEAEASKLLSVMLGLPDGSTWQAVTEKQAEQVLAEGRLERLLAS